MSRFVLILVASGVVAGGCSSNGSGPIPDGGMANQDLAGSLPFDLSHPLTDGGQQAGVFTASIGPFNLNPAEEIVMCSIVQLGNTTPIDVVRMDTSLALGSHHLIAYRSSATAPQPPSTCSSFDGVTHGEAPLFIAESKQSSMVLPSQAAYHLNAGQFIRLEAHYINTTQGTLQGMGTITFTAGAAGNYQPADIMMCGSVLTLQTACLPPGQASTTLPVGFYGGGSGVDFTKLKVFAFTSHEHHRGIDVKVWKSTGKNPTASQQLYDNPSWDNPPLQSYNDSNLLTFASGEGLAWQCSYDTSADTSKVCFGESANDEMCFIWAYYYPSVGRFVSETDCWLN